MNTRHHHHVGTSYLREITTNLRPIADLAYTELCPVRDHFDTLVCTGLSGLILTPLLATMLDMPFAIIRKDGENNHSGYPVEGLIGDRCLFVDDFSASGATARRVRTAIENEGARIVGRYYYENQIRLDIY